MLFAAGWYDARRHGLGAEFIEEMSTLVGSLAFNALLYAESLEGARRVVARRFPYVVTFVIVGDEVVVLSVLHVRRNRSR
jgi:plasmid stabilization system protein ParE